MSLISFSAWRINYQTSTSPSISPRPHHLPGCPTPGRNSNSGTGGRTRRAWYTTTSRFDNILCLRLYPIYYRTCPRDSLLDLGRLTFADLYLCSISCRYSSPASSSDFTLFLHRVASEHRRCNAPTGGHGDMPRNARTPAGAAEQTRADLAASRTKRCNVGTSSAFRRAGRLARQPAHPPIKRHTRTTRCARTGGQRRGRHHARHADRAAYHVHLYTAVGALHLPRFNLPQQRFYHLQLPLAQVTTGVFSYSCAGGLPATGRRRSVRAML